MTQPGNVLALDDALTRLAALDERLVQIVECRFFGGFSNAETADLLDVSTRTVERGWRRAKAHLFRMMGGEEGP